MGKVSDYAFINAKLRARIGIIRTETVIDDMIKAPTLSEAVAKLDGTRFSALAEIYRATGDLQQVELALVSNEIASYREVASYLEDRGKAFINVLLEKVEIDNLKNALRIWYSSAIRGHQINSRSPYIEKRLVVHPIDYEWSTHCRELRITMSQDSSLIRIFPQWAFSRWRSRSIISGLTSLGKLRLRFLQRTGRSHLPSSAPMST